MANKIKLGAMPKSFKPVTLKVEMPDGTEGELPITFKYRTQDEYWENRDAFFKAIGQKKPEGDAQNIPVVAKEARLAAAEHILGSIESWGLDIELSAANLCQMFNEVQQSSGVILNAYEAACLQGRLGN